MPFAPWPGDVELVAIVESVPQVGMEICLLNGSRNDLQAKAGVLGGEAWFSPSTYALAD